jgi:hypothetical protein
MMGMRPQAVMCYGIHISEDDIYSIKTPKEYHGETIEYIDTLIYRDFKDTLDIKYIGFCEYPEIIVCVGNKFTADWEPTVISETLPIPTADEIGPLKDLFKILKIEWTEPNWYLGAYYG